MGFGAAGCEVATIFRWIWSLIMLRNAKWCLNNCSCLAFSYVVVFEDKQNTSTIIIISAISGFIIMGVQIHGFFRQEKAKQRGKWLLFLTSADFFEFLCYRRP
ncbi:hypothetical protein RJ641_002077 [Dillenia turbinata]|uniref:Uncharacterized protein n=1 Tax=Dillenia turbinata TaxID=194707 RepID=A0AAN8VCH0_9MAGN